MFNENDINMIAKVVRDEMAPLRTAMRGDLSALEMAVKAELHALDQKFETRIDTLDQKLDSRINTVDTRFDSLDTRMTRLEDGHHKLGVEFESMQTDLETILEGVIAVNEKVDRMSSLEPRVTGCEENISVLRQAVHLHITDDKSHPTS